MSAEQQLQSLIARSEELNRSGTDLIQDVVGICGGYLKACERNVGEFRRLIAEAAMSGRQPQVPPPPQNQIQRGGDPLEAINNIRRGGHVG